VYAFGSRAQEIKNVMEGKAVPDPSNLSDIDIAFKVRENVSLSLREKVHLEMEIEDSLAAVKVDLCDLSDVDPFLAANIIRGERLYSEDSYQADEYELYILRRAGDVAHIEQERLGLILGERYS
jgi:predicted nucleotidyltransferase